MRFAYVLAEFLPAQLERQRRRLNLPLIISSPIDPSLVFACSPEAAQAGVCAGLSVYQARQMAPAAVVLAADEHAYYACHSALAAALQAYTPRLETVVLGEFLLETAPLAAVHGGDQALAGALAQAAANAGGLAVRVGLAEGRFAAEQAARQAPDVIAPDGGPLSATLVIPPGGEARFLAPLPIETLPGLPGEMRRRLQLFDLPLLGDLAALPKPAVLRQFGGAISSLYDLARGRDPRPLNPDVPPLRLVRSLRLAAPLSSRPLLLQAVERLTWRVAKMLNHKGYHAEALKLTVYFSDGYSQELGQAAKPPTSDEARLTRLAALLLGKLRPAAPVAALAVSVYPLRAWHHSAQQIELRAGPASQKLADFELTVQLLVHRFNRAVVRVAALLGPPLPLPIEVALDHQGRPAQVAWGGQARRVRAIHESWREEGQWWHPGRRRRRDYYRILLLDESYRNIFQDLLTEHWYLDRGWPIL
ncbi:MAG: hypothetical protein IT317_12335 [Anaerolineales bacterium]|nr:hypothetical protein [Anaerolineales bacterium]